MADEKIMNEENIELVELSELSNLMELSEDELDDVSGGRVVNFRKGAFTTQTEAALYAETQFKPGYWYNLKGVRVQCVTTGAQYNNGYWFAMCHYRTADNRTGSAAIGYFR